MFKNETKVGYSLALLDIAKDENKLKEFYKEASTILWNLENEDQFIEILDSSNIKVETKEDVIKKTFKGFHWALVNVMEMLASKNQFRYFKDILKNLIKNLQDILNIKQGIVYSTKPLTSDEIKKLEQKLKKQFDCEIKLTNLIDKELIGGFKVQLDSIVIEDSIKSELELIKKSLREKGGV